MFQLAKVWVDNAPNTHTVEIRYTWSKLGEPPTWNGKEEAEVMSVVPNTNPSTRLAVIEIPRYFDHEPNYLLHYRFGGGGEFHEGFNRDVTEEIVSREVEYVDNEGPHHRSARDVERRRMERSELVAGEAGGS